MIVPAVLYVAVLAFYPAVNAVYGSFFTRLGNFGLYNYNFVLSQYGTQPIVNTFIVTGSALLLQFTVAFLIATLLSKPFRGRSLFSAIFLIPFGVATIVTAVIFYHMFGIQGGYVNSFFRLIGVNSVNWTGTFSSSVFVLILADSWKNTPIVTLILLAGMTTISPDLYSQAMVDGAGIIQRFFRITLPNMAGYIAIALMIRGISEFNIFAMALLIFPHQLLTTMTYDLYDTINVHPSEAGATILLGFVMIFAILVMLYRTKYGKVS
jgi:ABC-type sugar transport system permease subunit